MEDQAKEQRDARDIHQRPSPRRRNKGQHGLGHIYEHRSSWWLDVLIKDKRTRVKLGPIQLLEKRDARQIADAKVKTLLMPKVEPVKGEIRFSEFARRFVAMSVETKRGWSRYEGKSPDETPFKYAFGFFGESLLREISTTRVEEFRSFLLTRRVGGNRCLKNASVNRYVSLLRAAFYWAISLGDAGSNPVMELNKKMLHDPPRADSRA